MGIKILPRSLVIYILENKKLKIKNKNEHLTCYITKTLSNYNN